MLRGSTYVYRRRIPTDVAHDPIWQGKEHHHESLRTSDRSTALAEAARVNRWFEEQVYRIRGRVTDTVLIAGRDYVLTDEALAAIQGDWWRSAMKRDEEERLGAELNPDSELADHLASRDDANHFDVASFNDPEKGMERLQRKRVELARDLAPFIRHECRKRGIEQGSMDGLRVQRALVEAELDVMRARYERWRGNIYVSPSIRAIRDGIERPEKREASWTVRQLAKHYNDKTRRSDGWVRKVDGVVELFEAHLGAARPISKVTRDDIRSFVDLLLQCPDRASMRFPGRTLADAVKLNKAREKPFQSIKPNTIRDTHYAVLRKLFAHARDISAVTTNPAEGIKVEGAQKRGGTRPSFNVDELNALFRLPVFAGCEGPHRPNSPGPHLIRDHRFWAPLIMLFSGARPSEIGQLAVSDVKLDARHPYISILTEVDPDDPEDRDYVVTAKTVNARREIPIHPELLAMGFRGYVEAARERHERLFPEWKQSGDPRKLYSTSTWIRTLNGKLIPSITSRRPRPTLYSLRHTCKRALVACGVPFQIQNQLLGHAKAGMDQHYFHEGVELDVLEVELGKLRYPHLNLEHLRPRLDS